MNNKEVIPLDELTQLSFQIILRPVSALLAATRSLQQSYDSLRSTGQLNDQQHRLVFGEFNTLIELDDLV